MHGLGVLRFPPIWPLLVARVTDLFRWTVSKACSGVAVLVFFFTSSLNPWILQPSASVTIKLTCIGSAPFIMDFASSRPPRFSSPILSVAEIVAVHPDDQDTVHPALLLLPADQSYTVCFRSCRLWFFLLGVKFSTRTSRVCVAGA